VASGIAQAHVGQVLGGITTTIHHILKGGTTTGLGAEEPPTAAASAIPLLYAIGTYSYIDGQLGQSPSNSGHVGHSGLGEILAGQEAQLGDWHNNALQAGKILTGHQLQLGAPSPQSNFFSTSREH
jgi:hypothetical protein